ncbi:hypothetical protein N7E81_10945 [Reichenbachiella carrageenanivorans]|uniref:Uncharacterized protein n=1 Tax=Reichenbachiella carrageenanivorans TaxID=2979869 RepID=A0ABY6CX21_9BACT|nr:hypothetical protein [Reichenbachiella carrageenanivorans]UXX77884.1 hypothetical protein N7E81_10945 [Reichenbachiella carrageenanivorans]
MAEESPQVLYMARLEEARAQAQEPDSFRRTTGYSLCLESHSDGWMDSSPKSYTENDHYHP